MARNYRDLIAWQRAMDLVVVAYCLTDEFPREEIYCLTAQLRRAAISVPSNIAEGEGRGTKNEFVHFLRIAHGSLREVETQITLGVRLGYASAEQESEALLVTSEVGKLINGLIRSKR